MLVDELVDLGWCGFLNAPICFMKIYAFLTDQIHPMVSMVSYMSNTNSSKKFISAFWAKNSSSLRLNPLSVLNWLLLF